MTYAAGKFVPLKATLTRGRRCSFAKETHEFPHAAVRRSPRGLPQHNVAQQNHCEHGIMTGIVCCRAKNHMLEASIDGPHKARQLALRIGDAALQKSATQAIAAHTTDGAQPANSGRSAAV